MTTALVLVTIAALLYAAYAETSNRRLRGEISALREPAPVVDDRLLRVATKLLVDIEEASGAAGWDHDVGRECLVAALSVFNLAGRPPSTDAYPGIALLRLASELPSESLETVGELSLANWVNAAGGQEAYSVVWRSIGLLVAGEAERRKGLEFRGCQFAALGAMLLCPPWPSRR